MTIKTKKIYAFSLILLLVTARASYGLSVPTDPKKVSKSAAEIMRDDFAHRKRTRRIARRISLEKLFGPYGIKSVFDVGVGTGSWMHRIKEQPWVAEDALIMGSELETPTEYFKDKNVVALLAEMKEEPTPDFYDSNWYGLSVAQDKTLFPSEGSVDLVHLAFMQADYLSENGAPFDKGEPVFYERLNEYDRLLKEDGWVIITHITSYPGFSGRVYTWLREHSYEYQTYQWYEIPLDYPTTAWWNYYRMHMIEQRKPYMIIAKKRTRSMETVSDLWWQHARQESDEYIEEKGVQTPDRRAQTASTILSDADRPPKKRLRIFSTYQKIKARMTTPFLKSA